MGITARLEQRLDWFTMTVWLYDLDKAAHTALLGLLVHALVPQLPLLAALVVAWATYLIVGKVISYFGGAVGWGNAIQELGDFLADGWTGALPIVLVEAAMLPPLRALLTAVAWAIGFLLLAWWGRP